VRKDLVCCLLVTCLLHLGGTFLIRVRFFERPSFIRVTSPNNECMFFIWKYHGSHCNPMAPAPIMQFVKLNTAPATNGGWSTMGVRRISRTHRSMQSKEFKVMVMVDIFWYLTLVVGSELPLLVKQTVHNCTWIKHGFGPGIASYDLNNFTRLKYCWIQCWLAVLGLRMVLAGFGIDFHFSQK
jgi:hypothetical protein